MFDTTFEDVSKLINSWKPKRRYSRESQYRDDLLAYLREELNKPSPWGQSRRKHKIQKESGRSLADIAIDDKIGIELKYNLDTLRKADSLFGQIERYSRNYRDVIVLLCGKTDEDKINYFESKLSSLKPRGDLFYEQRIKIFNK